jgi:ribosome maturation factor RimP
VDPLALQTRIRTLVESTISRLGFDLVAVEWGGGLLRLSIDRPPSSAGAGDAPGGISAEDCARVSEQLSPLLDAEDPIPSRYTLEVSSPGIERPVQRREDFERFVGFRVRLRLSEGPPRRRYVGVIGPIEQDELLISVDGAIHRIPLDLIERAHLVLDLDEYQKLAEGTP